MDLNEILISNLRRKKMEDLLENIWHEIDDELQTIDIWYSSYYQIMKLMHFEICIMSKCQYFRREKNSIEILEERILPIE